MDPTELVRQGAECLQPLLPFVLEKVAEGFTQRAGEKGFEKSLATVKGWWKRLLGSPEGRAVEQAAAKLEQKGDDPRRLQAFELVLGDALEQSPELLSELQELLPNLQVLARIVVEAHAGSTVVMPGGVGTKDESTHFHLHPPAVPDRTDPNALRESYLSSLLAECESLSLEVFDFRDADRDEGKTRLSSVYTALQVESPRAERREAPKPSSETVALAGQREERRWALSVLAEHPRLVLLGEPGSGKSTFLSFVAACHSGEWLGHERANLERLRQVPKLEEDEGETEVATWAHAPLLPVKIILRDFVEATPPPGEQKPGAERVWAFLEKQMSDAKLRDGFEPLRRELLERGGLLLFDGLDEVQEADRWRETVQQSVAAFVAALPHCRALVTCRTYAYQDKEWQFDDFAVATLAPFCPSLVGHFVDRWYREATVRHGLGLEEAERKAEDLKHAIGESGELSRLAERPLLLTLIASLHRAGEVVFPVGRLKLYERAVALLLDRWERARWDERNGKRVVVEKSIRQYLELGETAPLLAALSRLAIEGHSKQRDRKGTADLASDKVLVELIDVSPKDARERLHPRELERLLERRLGILVLRKPKVYSFPHRSFQEYLAALAVTAHDDSNQESLRLVREDPDRWREVFLLSVLQQVQGPRLKPQPYWLLLKEALVRSGSEAGDEWALHLLAQAGVEMGIGPPSAAFTTEFEAFRLRIADLLGSKHLPAYERALAGRNLAALGDPRRHVTDLDEMQFCWVPPGPFLMGSAHDDARAYDDEKYPEGESRELTLEQGYWMARFPVTVSQWRRYLKDAKREAGNPDSERGEGNEPVVYVDWEEATKMCSWLTEQWRRKGWLPRHWQVRLPTEAEWERAARGGLKLPFGKPTPMALQDLARSPMPPATELNPAKDRVYPWPGEGDPNLRNGGDSGIGRPSAVGCFALGASPYGCEEMSGNVWEWTRSRFLPYPFDSEERDVEIAQDEEHLRVVRGGAYWDGSRRLRASCRVRNHLGSRNLSLGFRLLVSPFSL